MTNTFLNGLKPPATLAQDRAARENRDRDRERDRDAPRDARETRDARDARGDRGERDRDRNLAQNLRSL